MKKELIELRVNGRRHELAVEPSELLLDVLRRDLQLTGSKRGCDDSSVAHVPCWWMGSPRWLAPCLHSALLPMVDHSRYYNGGRHRRSRCAGGDPESLWRLGRCTMRLLHPGFMITVKALLDRNPEPTEDDIRHALSGNLCRCTGYTQMYQAIKAAIAAEQGR